MWPGWPSTATGGAAQRRRETEQASRLEEGEKDRFVISEILGT